MSEVTQRRIEHYTRIAFVVKNIYIYIQLYFTKFIIRRNEKKTINYIINNKKAA